MRLHNRSIKWILTGATLSLAIAGCSGDIIEPLDPKAESLDPDVVAFERTCAAEDVLAAQMAADPDLADRMAGIEEHASLFNLISSQAVSGVVVIPTVVHVVYNGSTQNISDAQIQSQIDVLNADFRRLNADRNNTWSQAADTEIQFCWVGTSRTSTTKTSFGTNDSIKFTAQGGRDVYQPDRYLNMWVGNIGGGILGYAQFPGGAASTDGVVMDYRYFGTVGTATAPFHLGRTTTHEVGHWLNLRHIWGDGGCGVDDFVTDTPTSDAANFGCATGHISCSTVDMVQNYMDYSDDSCMNLFTAGQTTRMRALFDTGGSRKPMYDNSSCAAVDLGAPPPPPPPPPSCTTNEVQLTLNFDNYPGETSWDVRNGGGTVMDTGTGYTGAGTTVVENICLADGCYNLTVFDSYGDGMCCAYGSGSYSLADGGTVLASGGSFTSSQTTNFCVGGGPPPPPTEVVISNTNFSSGFGVYTDGGVDCRTLTSTLCPNGGTCAELRDNSGVASAFTTTTGFNLTGFTELEIDFWFRMNSFELNEDFWVQYSSNGGSTWTTIATFARNTAGFANNTAYHPVVTINSGSHAFTSNAKLRFQADASTDSDQVYIDDVIVTAR